MPDQHISNVECITGDNYEINYERMGILIIIGSVYPAEPDGTSLVLPSLLVLLI